MTDKEEPMISLAELEEKEREESKKEKRSNNEYSELMDSNTADIKYLINDIIDRTGIINHLEVVLPKSCLKDVLKALDYRMEDGLMFQMNVDSKVVHLKFFNR